MRRIRQTGSGVILITPPPCLPELLYTRVVDLAVDIGRESQFVHVLEIGAENGFCPLEGNAAVLQMYGTEIVGTEPPAAAVLTVSETEPGIQGDRVSGARKPATMETGVVVQVPLFIEAGERLKIDTRSGDYIERANG